jgi:DNA-nicking Smr family endonuclease
MRKKNRVSAEDAALFRTQVGPVKPLTHDKLLFEKKLPKPRPLQRLRDEQQVLIDMLSDDYDAAELETGEELLFNRPGIQHSVLRKLRRGQYSVGAQLDLHGMTVAVARVALGEFLHDCRRNAMRCVRIIHGKGRGSRNKGPVLKGKVNHWLMQRDEVLAFCSAPRTDGGTGAVYVLLKTGS